LKKSLSLFNPVAHYRPHYVIRQIVLSGSRRQRLATQRQ
jgi:hypothetical protein